MHRPFVLLMVLSVLLGAYLLSSLSMPMALLAAVGFGIFVLSFVSTRFAIYLLIFSMLLSPEFGAMHGEVGEGRSLVVRLDDIFLVIISLSWIARIAMKKEGLGLFRRTPLGKPITSYVSIVIVATVLGIMMERVAPAPGFFYCLKYVQYFVLFYMMVNYLETREQARNIVAAAFATCAVICLYAMLKIPSGERVSAPFEGEGGEPNTLGGYLVFMLSMVAGLFLTVKKPKERLVLALMGCLIFIPLLYTLSRSSWIALFPMFLSLLVYSRKKLWLFAFLGLFVALSPVLLPEQVVERARSTFEEENWHGTTERIGSVSFDPSASERISRYRDSLGRWTLHPILGYGVTGGGFIDGQFLRTLEETGCAGLLVMLWLLVRIFRTARRNYYALSDPFFSGLSLGLLASVAALSGHAMGSSTFIIVRIMEPFWLMVAIVVRAPGIVGEVPAPTPGGDPALFLKARLRDERPVSRKVVV